MNDEQIEALRTKYGFDRIGIIEGEMYLPMKEVFEKLVQRWIPCSERMPENRCEAVLATTRDGILWTAIYEPFNGKDEWFDDNYEKKLDVIAWMPLPEPYKEEGEENG